LFLGRLHRDKGVLDLVAAWSRLAGLNPDLHLAIVGPDEGDLVPTIRGLTGSEFASRLHVAGLSTEPQDWMAASDVLCLPSLREGFGNVIVEAGSCEVAVIASRIYGISDAVIENVTGLVHRPGDQGDLVRCLLQLIHDGGQRRKFGRAGRAVVIEKFEQSRVVEGYARHFAQACNIEPAP
jgi:glycosyltransferase involved in cell wall biosynthesis